MLCFCQWVVTTRQYSDKITRSYPLLGGDGDGVSLNVTPKMGVQVTVAFNKDPSPMKLKLGVGAYHTEVCVISYISNFVCKM
jgi:hypothetical protein